MDIAGRMVLFAHVVDRGSFSAAGRSLALSPSAVSKQIGRLEDHLGVRLLSRSTRRIALTEEGRVFYERCARIATDISERPFPSWRRCDGSSPAFVELLYGQKAPKPEQRLGKRGGRR